MFGNAERQICEIAHRLAAGRKIEEIDDLRGTAFVRKALPAGWAEIDSTTIDTPGPLAAAGRSVSDGADGSERKTAASVSRRDGMRPSGFAREAVRAMDGAAGAPMDGFTASSRANPEGRGDVAVGKAETVLKFHRRVQQAIDREHSVIRMPSYEAVADDPILYAHASRILHLEANPG